MGYYTDYRLTIRGASPPTRDEVEASTEITWNLTHSWESLPANELCYTTTDCRFDWEGILPAMAKAYPDVLFILDGDGDAPNDIWRGFWQGEKHYLWSPDESPPDLPLWSI